MHSDSFHHILIFLGAAVVIVPLFRYFRSSPILGYLAAGVIIGPHGFSFINEIEGIHALAEFGVVFLLFKVGLELSIERLRLMKQYVFLYGSLQVLLTGFILFLIAYAFNFGAAAAIIIGGGLALSSTAFVMQLLNERQEQTARYGVITFAILLFQDIAVVPLLALVPLLGETGNTLGHALELAALKTTLALVGIFVIGRLFLRPFYRIIANTKSPELFVITTLLVVLGTSAIMAEAGLSMALGAFLAGTLLAETEYRHQVESDIKPFKGILLGLFFTAIGMTINLELLQHNWPVILGGVFTLVLLKAAITSGILMYFKQSYHVAIPAGMFLAQGGEFGFVLFTSAHQVAVINDTWLQILNSIIALSMITTPFLVSNSQRFTSWLKKRSHWVLGRLEMESEKISPSGHVLIAGFGRVGQSIAKVLSVSGVQFVALDLDHRRVTHCRKKQIPVFYGDSSRLGVLQATGANKAKACVITFSDENYSQQIIEVLHRNYPDLPVFVRSKDRKGMIKLEQAGATGVVQEPGESALQLGTMVLYALGTGQDEISHVIGAFRENDYERFEDVIL